MEFNIITALLIVYIPSVLFNFIMILKDVKEDANGDFIFETFFLLVVGAFPLINIWFTITLIKRLTR